MNYLGILGGTTVQRSTYTHCPSYVLVWPREKRSRGEKGNIQRKKETAANSARNKGNKNSQSVLKQNLKF